MSSRWESFVERYKAARNSPEVQAQGQRFRRLRLAQLICLLVFAPFAFGAIPICQSLGWRGHVFVPIIFAIWVTVAKVSGSYLAKRNEP